MGSESDFLTPSLKEIRKSIRDIDSSYSHEWDILAELCQNAVDAIRKKKGKKGKIELFIDSVNKKITIEDNGIGIEPADLGQLLKPFATDKDDDDDSIGEKGVGLTFVMFSSNSFKILTGTKDGTTTGEVKNAANWKGRNDKTKLKLEIKLSSEKLLGTKIILGEFDSVPIFNLSFEQLIFVLRTRTALGNTKPLWRKDLNIKVTVRHLDQNGNERKADIPYRYLTVYDDLQANSKINLDDFVEWIASGDKTDDQKRRKLRDKIIYKTGEITHTDQRKIRYVACFVPKRKTWEDISVKSKLCTAEQYADKEWQENYYYSKFQAGIFTSVKGMPTGVLIEHPETGYAGYWSNIFILFEDKHLKFDIGRKFIHGMQARIYREYSRQIFQEFMSHVTKYVSGEVVVDTEWDKEEIFAEIDAMLDLDLEGIQLSKTPKDQEASVAALFFECIGNGKISGITPLTSGYKNKYDLYAKWGNKKIVVEFKSKLKNILRDFTDQQKMFNQLNCIVCWNVTEDDIEAMHKKGISVEEISQSELGTGRKVVPHATHELILSGFVDPIFIIDLKKIVSN